MLFLQAPFGTSIGPLLDHIFLCVIQRCIRQDAAVVNLLFVDPMFELNVARSLSMSNGLSLDDHFYAGDSYDDFVMLIADKLVD